MQARSVIFPHGGRRVGCQFLGACIWHGAAEAAAQERERRKKGEVRVFCIWCPLRSRPWSTGRFLALARQVAPKNQNSCSCFTGSCLAQLGTSIRYKG